MSKKSFIILFAALCAWGICYSQNTYDAAAQCEKYFLLYQNGTSAQLRENWKRMEVDTMHLTGLQKIQSDVFGEISGRARITYKSIYNLSDGNATLEANYDSIFLAYPDASMQIRLAKGKKKKSNYFIEDIQFRSGVNSQIAFIDSLCAPYLTLIQDKNKDSLFNILFPKEKMDALISEIDQMKSRKKREEAEMAYGFIMLATGMIMENVDSIDPNAAYEYVSTELNMVNLAPVLKVQYRFQTLEKEEVRINLSYQTLGNEYTIKTIGFSKTVSQ
jgi:hypothetical protein